MRQRSPCVVHDRVLEQAKDSRCNCGDNLLVLAIDLPWHGLAQAGTVHATRTVLCGFAKHLVVLQNHEPPALLA